MKKALLTLAAIACAFAASAQFTIGGNIAFNTNGGHYYENTTAGSTTTEFTVPGMGSAKNMSLAIMPKIGYDLNDQMSVGAYFGITMTSNTTFNAVGYAADPNYEGWTKQSTFGWTFQPYFRYNVVEFGNFKFFAEAQIGLVGQMAAKIHDYQTKVGAFPARDTTFKAPTKSFTWGISIVPGLNYSLSENMSLDLYIDLARLAFVSNKLTYHNEYTVAGVSCTDHNETVTNTFFVGADATANTLANHFSAFRLGFNYHF